MINTKECIIIDTNLVFNTNTKACDIDLTEFKLNPIYDSLLHFLEISELNEKYDILIPEIVFDELEKQQEELYRTEVNKLNESFKSIKKFAGNNLTISNIDYLDYIRNERKNYVEKEKIKMIPIPKTVEIFEKIIERVKNKQKPFCGQKGNTDKGFKDVLLWESIIFNAQTMDYKRYNLVTENSSDFIKSLEEEFNQVTKKEINIFYQINELQDFISKMNSVKFDGNLIQKIIESDLESGELEENINNALLVNYKQEDINKYGILKDLKLDNFIYEGNNIGSFYLINKDCSDYLASGGCIYIKFTVDSSNNILIDEALFAI